MMPRFDVVIRELGSDKNNEFVAQGVTKEVAGIISDTLQRAFQGDIINRTDIDVSIYPAC